ncbi:unnamed protein product [marine sediment metagenome]|uniref:Uncharacterized protein n=1 Tax=marine sediment metagenome TaxID=412755 RepID=X0SY86_9ZZZZ
MRRAILTFELPEDQDEYDIHCNAPRRHEAMRKLHYELRNMVKHGDYDKTLAELAEYVYELTWEYVD